MRKIPYKLRTDAWWLGDDFSWRKPQKQPPLDPANRSMISDCDFGGTLMVDANREQHPDRRR